MTDQLCRRDDNKDGTDLDRLLISEYIALNSLPRGMLGPVLLISDVGRAIRPSIDVPSPC